MIEDDFSNNVFICLGVKRLPRDALIELEILAHTDKVAIDLNLQKSKNS